MLTNTATTAPEIVAPYKVDTTAGSHRGDVSSQWMSRPADQRFPDLDALYEFKRRSHEESFEKREETNKVEIIAPDITSREDMSKLTVGLANVKMPGADVARTIEVAPTHHAFGQLCGLAKAPASYLRELPSQLVTDQLNYRLRHAREIEDIKLYGNAAQLMAATGPDYGRIPDFEVVEALRTVAGNGLGEGGFRWKTPGTLDWATSMYDPEAIGDAMQRTFYASDRDLFCFVVDDRNPIEVGKTKDGNPDLMFRGFYIQNSEVGTRSLKLASFYLRAVCMNRNLWGVEGFEDITIRHTRLAPDRWLQQAKPALESFAEGSQQKLIDGVHKAKAAKLAKDDDEAMEYLQGLKFSKARAARVLEISEAEEGRKPRTAWDFAQGITALARSVPNTDDRLDIELTAKRILDKVAA